MTVYEEAQRLLDPRSALTLMREEGVAVESLVVTSAQIRKNGFLVGFLLHGSDPAEETPAFVRVFTDGSATEFAKEWTVRAVPTPLGPGARLVLGGQGLLFVFPNDHRLRRLPALWSMGHRAGRILRELEPMGPSGWRLKWRSSTLSRVGYRPERRFVGRAKLRREHEATRERRKLRAFLRYFKYPRGGSVARRVKLLWGAGFRNQPQLLGTALGGRVLLEEEVAGATLRSAVLAGGGDPEALAQAMLDLHGAAITDLPPTPPEEAVALVEGRFADMRTLGVPVAPVMRELLEWLRASLPPSEIVYPIHGDLHAENVLWDEERGRIAMVDFEQSGMGHPLQDVGHISAQLLLVAERKPPLAPGIIAFNDQLVAAYMRRGVPQSLRELDFFLALSLLRASLTPMWSAGAAWKEKSEAALALALRVVDRS